MNKHFKEFIEEFDADDLFGASIIFTFLFAALLCIQFKTFWPAIIILGKLTILSGILLGYKIVITWQNKVKEDKKVKESKPKQEK